MPSACGRRLLRIDLLELAEQFGAHHFGDGDAIASVTNSVLERLGVRLLAVVDEVTVEINLEAALTRWCECHTHLPIDATCYLGCHTGGLEEVASRNAVLDLQLHFAFSHQTS